MKPILLDLGGIHLQSYGVSKALAFIVAGWLLHRELQRRGRDPQPAFGLALAGMVGGFVGAKLYYLAEVAGTGLTMHDFGPSGFTWYGGLMGGSVAVFLVSRRHGLPPALMAGMAAIPLAVAYGIGRLGCLLAGDGTYGKPSDLPWGMSFPDGAMPTSAVVHPTPVYEAIAAFAIALVLLLWRLRDRVTPLTLFGVFAVLYGLQRFVVEFVRINDGVLLSLTAPQLWSVAFAVLGAIVIARRTRALERPVPAAAG